MALPLPVLVDVSKMRHTPGYSEPTVIWRMRRGDGQSSHAIIDPGRQKATVLWFVNNHRLGSRDFRDLTTAVRWCEQIQAQYWAAGWRAE